ncbi:hypothetical protein DEU56DRAFT_761718 [Suillus clintonianus]|uniref:uncharacterized protein n=1 Tax=Suillus clintonianus TaxID=1904413 RepID=UPI001B8791FD|nr:uncharacterized protein DEU56DRAFT_761718 [Suillus clintonianus]KAG2115037.1 hypothetical protein DEU56DRAFT_761718 [Suillus clintonianus]
MTPYSLRLVVAASVSQSIAILLTIFRLVYRGWTRQLWWEDAWAALALVSDGVCLAWIWVRTTKRLPAWTFAAAFTSVVWTARMSIIFSIIRIANPSGDKVHKRITYLIAVSFVCMWAALVAYKITMCTNYSCRMTRTIALLQLTTDIAGDFPLIVAPLQFWKNAGLSRNNTILIMSVFGSSILITIVTIPHSIMLFHSVTETTLIMSKRDGNQAALSLVVCNVLVIVTLAYRVFWKERLELDQSFTSPGIFSSVIVTQFPSDTNSRTSPSVQEETNQDK